MDRSAIRASIFAAARLRMPAFDRTSLVSTQIDTLSDYLVEVSIHRGNVEEGRLFAREALNRLRQEWEAQRPGESPDTLKAVRDGGEEWRPKLAAMKDARYLIDRATESVDRLDSEYRVASRLLGPLIAS